MSTKQHEIISTSRPRHPQFKDLIDQRFDALIVTGFVGVAKQGKGRVTLWKVRCDCGRETTAASGHLRSRHTRSCGCLHAANLKSGRNKRTHGWSSLPGFSNWRTMVRRCVDPKATGYELYGGRGIRVHEPWRVDFAAFMEHIGPYPGRAFTIERKDSNGHYEPGNVRWATRLEQAQNTSRNRFVMFRGEKLCASELARRFGLSRGVVLQRLIRGETPEQAIRPARSQRPRAKHQTNTSRKQS